MTLAIDNRPGIGARYTARVALCGRPAALSIVAARCLLASERDGIGRLRMAQV